MTDLAPIELTAIVEDTEQIAVRLAASMLQNALNAATDHQFAIDCRFDRTFDTPQIDGRTGILITSLLPEVAHYSLDWPDVEKMLRRRFEAVMSSGYSAVFLCTVFRHVPIREPGDKSKLVRVRRLNLLAAELSRELGVFVIDLDRALTDVGAKSLETDYQLSGRYAAGIVAKNIALAVVSVGLDDYASFETQDAAKIAISTTVVEYANVSESMYAVDPVNVISLSVGRRKQIVSTVVDINAERHVGRLFELVLTRQFSLHDALRKLRASVARRGAWSSAAMIVTGAWHVLRSRTRMMR
jgi:hypothetical protein